MSIDLMVSSGMQESSSVRRARVGRCLSAFVAFGQSTGTCFIRLRGAGCIVRHLAAGIDLLRSPPARRHSRLSFLALAAGMLAVLLSGCAGKPGAVDPSAVDQIQGELEALLRQPYIDPLVRYLERYRADPARADHLKLVSAERDKRCVVIANLYKSREATLANLKKLERGYRLACPSVVDDFTAKLAKQTVQAESPNTAIAAVESLKATSPSQKELQNCYLLFSIANYREAQDARSAPARGGDARAQYGMAVIARIRQHYPESVKWSEKAAAQGLPEAEQHLGLLYLEGKGVPKEAAQALKWFETAGGHGVAEASARAGLMHYRGEGVPQNDDKARKWFSIAAQAGDAQAQMFLGEIYEKGAGVARDGEAARQWFSKAAEQGLAQAQGRLGAIYATGHGVQQDNMEAYHWLSLAVAGGNDSARSLRDSVARAMTPEQLSTARERLNRTLERRP